MQVENITYSNMLILHVPDALEHASTNGVTKILGCGLGVDVAEVHGPVHGLNTAHAICHVAGVQHINGRELGASVLSKWRKIRLLRCHRLLGNQRLSGGGLCLLRSGLLGLGDVGAAVFTIVDTLPSPRWLSRKGVYDLRKT